MKYRVSVVNENGDKIIHNIIGDYSKKEAVNHVINLAENDHGGKWFLDSVVEVEG